MAAAYAKAANSAISGPRCGVSRSFSTSNRGSSPENLKFRGYRCLDQWLGLISKPGDPTQRLSARKERTQRSQKIMELQWRSAVEANTETAAVWVGSELFICVWLPNRKLWLVQH